MEISEDPLMGHPKFWVVKFCLLPPRSHLAPELRAFHQCIGCWAAGDSVLGKRRRAARLVFGAVPFHRVDGWPYSYASGSSPRGSNAAERGEVEGPVL